MGFARLLEIVYILFLAVISMVALWIDLTTPGSVEFGIWFVVFFFFLPYGFIKFLNYIGSPSTGDDSTASAKDSLSFELDDKQRESAIKAYVKEFEANRRLKDGNEVALLYVALEYLMRKEYPKAIEAATEAARQNPDMPEPYTLIATAYCNSGNYKRAEEMAQRAISLGYRGTDIYITLYLCYSNMGERLKALESSLRAIAADPENYNAYNCAAMAYLKLGSPDRAKSMAEAALRHDAEDVCSLYVLVLSLIALGEEDKAIEHLSLLTRLDRGLSRRLERLLQAD